MWGVGYAPARDEQRGSGWYILIPSTASGSGSSLEKKTEVFVEFVPKNKVQFSTYEVKRTHTRPFQKGYPKEDRCNWGTILFP